MIVFTMKQIQLDNNWKIIFTLIGLAVIAYLIWIFRVVIAYVLIAAMVSFVGEPIMRLLKKLRIRNFVLPSWLRAVITIVFFCSLLLGLMLVFTPLLLNEIQIISSIDPNQMALKFQEHWSSIQGAMDQSNSIIDQRKITEYLVQQSQTILSFGWFSALFSNLFGTISKLIIGGVSVLFITFFFLKDGFLFTRIIFTLTPDRHMDKMKNILDHSHSLLGRYFVGIILQSLIMWAMVSIGLWLLGIPNALLIGLFAGVINVVPYVGPVLGALFGLLIAISTAMFFDGNTDILPIVYKVLGVAFVAQQIDGFVVQPLILGNSVKAHPLEIFLVVLAAGSIAGIMGMVLAIPIYTLLRVVAKEFLSEFKVVESLTRELDKEE